MPVAAEPIATFFRLRGTETPRERAAMAWSRLTTGRSVHSIAAVTSDLACFGRAQWKDPHVERTIARVIAALDNDRRSFGVLARAHIDAERLRGCGAATLRDRWGTFAALARALSELQPRAPAIDLGARPVARGSANAREILAALLVAHRYRDACIVGLVAETRMRREEIAEMRIGDLAARGGSSALRRAIAEHTRGKDAQAFAFEGRARGSACDRKAIDRAVERHGTTVSALRRGKAER